MENSDSTEIVRKRVATNPSENVHLKRSRIKPNRLGVASTNKDNYFEMDKSQDSTEETTSQQSESDFVESADESDSFKENELSTPDNGVYRRQMSRFEAKLDHIQTVVVQIQRMCITSKVGDKIEHFKHFSELPLKTVMQIEDFEAKLVQDEYRKDIVSILINSYKWCNQFKQFFLYTHNFLFSVRVFSSDKWSCWRQGRIKNHSIDCVRNGLSPSPKQIHLDGKVCQKKHKIEFCFKEKHGPIVFRCGTLL